MAWNDRIASLIWAVLGICLCVESWRLGLGSVTDPGAGYMPFLVGFVVIMFSVFLFIESSIEIRKKTAKKVLIWAQAGSKRAIYIVLCILGYVLLLPKLGYLVATFLVMVFLFKSGRAIKWHWTILAGLLTSSLSWIIFGIWLKVSFPTGIFSF